MNNIDEPLFEDDLRQQEPGALHNADLADQYLEESDKEAKEKYDYYAKLAAISYDEA